MGRQSELIPGFKDSADICQTPQWKPFSQPDRGHVTAKGTSQLNALLMKFHDDPNYLHDFITVVNLGLDAVPPAPADYANYLPSLVGKPLALVNTGWSLELATNPLQNQSLQSLDRPAEKALLSYQFPLRLGDPYRVFDGLIAFYDVTPNTYNPTTQTSTGPTLGLELSLDNMYTYFLPPSPASTSVQPIDTPKSTHFIPLDTIQTPHHPQKHPSIPASPAKRAVLRPWRNYRPIHGNPRLHGHPTHREPAITTLVSAARAQEDDSLLLHGSPTHHHAQSTFVLRPDCQTRTIYRPGIYQRTSRRPEQRRLGRECRSRRW